MKFRVSLQCLFGAYYLSRVSEVSLKLSIISPVSLRCLFDV